MFEKVMEEIKKDIHSQPDDEWHSKGIKEGCEHLLFIDTIYPFKTVLDLGCGSGLACKIFQEGKKECTGVNLSGEKTHEGVKILKQDIHNLDIPDNSYDLIFARHIIEHSPIPMHILFECKRIAKYSYIVVPDCNWLALSATNHYSVLTPEMWEKLFERVGLKIIEKIIGKWHAHPKGVEYRYLLK